MNTLVSHFDSVYRFYKGLSPGIYGQNWFLAVGFGIFFFVLVWAVEKVYGTRTGNYRSRNFVHDLVYWFYARSSLHYFLFMAAIVAAIKGPLGFIDPPLATHLPFALQVVVFLLLNDFCAYWMHRAQHHYKFLWAFHAIHHSQEKITFVSGARFHPLEALVTNLLIYIPLRIAGFDAVIWLPLTLVLTLQIEIEHSQIPWRYGPLYRIMVSPVFHSYHHAIDVSYRDKHFGQTFSFWDYLFGTAVKSSAPVPTRFGVEGVKPKSLWDTLVIPFFLLREYYGTPSAGQAPAKTSLSAHQD